MTDDERPLYNPYLPDGRRKHHHEPKRLQSPKFEKGNQLWKLRYFPLTSFDGPEEFLEKARGYFQWCEDNPIRVDRIVSTKNGYERVTEDKPRAMTLQGLSTHIGMSVNRLYLILKEDEQTYGDAVAYVSDIIKENKFTGAAAGVFNANLIIRDLGLADKSKKDLSDPPDEKALKGVNIKFTRPSDRTPEKKGGGTDV